MFLSDQKKDEVFMEHQIAKRVRQPPKRRPGAPVCLTSTDVKILQYVWMWKVSSTASIHESINRPASPYSTYKRLEKLEKNGYLICHFHDVERFNLWSLSERGFLSVQSYLGDLAEEGYLSENHRHDRLVQAFQLGEWATHQWPKVIFFTEQEMRRKDVDQFPEWVPQTKEHRADGYTRIVGEKKPWTLAYEVELSAKNVQKYEGTLRFYKGAKGVDRILWLVATPFIRDQILRAKACIRDESQNYHVFVDLEDFLKNGWDAAVTNECSETLFTLREKYQGIAGDLIREMLGSYKGQSRVTVHLDSKKVLGKTRR